MRVVTVLVLVGLAASRAAALPERFTAFAVNLGSPGRSFAETVELVVSRWSSDAERDRLLSILMEQGADKLLDALREMPRVGYIRTPDSLAYDLRFARREPSEEGGERIVLATDRYISFWEAANRPRSIDYPFTVIELRIDRHGEGEGKMSLATKIVPDKARNLITLENYATQPVLLKSVRRQAGSG